MIGGLQMLRGLAATLVVLFHLQAAAIAEGHQPGILGWFEGGEVGVDVFFVLSGFVIVHAARGRQHLGAGWFLRQRFWRIVPPYWAVLALTLVAMAGLAVMRGDWAEWPGLGTILVSVVSAICPPPKISRAPRPGRSGPTATTPTRAGPTCSAVTARW